MLTEDEVVLKTCEWLKAQNCQINNRCLGTERGDDITATMQSGERLLVECKGAVSPRSGNSFSGNYAWRMSAGALFNTIRAVEQDQNALFALALPSTETYRTLFSSLRPFCARNRIYVFWLNETGVIDVWQPESNKRFRAMRVGECA